MCSVYGTLKTSCYQKPLRLVILSRCMKSILRKALRGEGVKLVVLGGSNSTGTGGCFGADEKSLDGFYFRVQGRSQTSEQDEASFERRRREQLGGSGGMPSQKSLKFRGSEMLL